MPATSPSNETKLTGLLAEFADDKALVEGAPRLSEYLNDLSRDFFETVKAGLAAAGVPFDGAVRAGQAIRILTGAAVPEGVDTVILEEDVTTDGSQIAFRGPLKQGANTRKAGEDVAAGDVILPAGRCRPMRATMVRMRSRPMSMSCQCCPAM